MVLGNFQCQGILLIWILIGQRPTVLAIAVDEDRIIWIFFLLPIVSLLVLSPSGIWVSID